MEELILILAQLDEVQKKLLLDYIKELLVEQPSCRSWLVALAFAAKIIS